MNSKFVLCGAIAACASFQTATAAPTVKDSTISWPANGWYQVQRPVAQNGNPVNWDVCNTNRNKTSCTVPNGTYRVNRQGGSPWRTLEIWDDVVVGGSTSDPGVYKPIWREDFNGNTVSSNFAIPSWEVGGRDVVISKPGACAQANGVLQLSIKQVGNERRACYLISKAKSFGPGDKGTVKIEFRADVSGVKAKGAWFAGWVYAGGSTDGKPNAEDGKPATGMEIDVFEYFKIWDTHYSTAVHDKPIKLDGWIDAQNFGVDLRSSGFHTYALEWNKSCLAFFLDGKRVRTEKSYVSSAQNHAIHLSMEAQTGYQWGIQDARYYIGLFATNLSQAPAVGKVDWVTVSRKESIDAGMCN